MAGYGYTPRAPSRYVPVANGISTASPAAVSQPAQVSSARQQADAQAAAERARYNARHDAMVGGRYTPAGYSFTTNTIQGPVTESAPGGGGGGVGGSGARRASSGAGGAGGYQDLTMSDYNTALSRTSTPEIPGRPAAVRPIDLMDRSAAESAAFGRAKDQAGLAARAGANDLADEMSARGISGSGLEGGLLTQILGTAQGQMGEASRDQAIDRMKRADQVTDTNYQGSLQQRSQDLEARSQEIAAQQAQQSNAMRLMELLRRSVV